MPNRIASVLILVCLGLFFVSVPLVSMAEEDPLAAEAALLEGKAQPKKSDADADPNPKLLAEVHTARKALEKRVNEYQSVASEFLDLDEGLQAATQKMMKANEAFFSTHGKLVADYVNGGKEKKSLTRKIENVRKTFLKNIKKVDADLDKLQKLEKKLRAAVAKEDAEAAKAEAANQEGDGDDNGDGSEGDEGDGEE